MLRATVCALMGWVMLAATPVTAREVLFSLENRIGGDRNISRTVDDTVDDGYYEVVPKFRFREAARELTYDFQYSPIYKTFFETSGIDGWDHLESAELNWNFTPRDTIGFNQRFRETRQVREDIDQTFGSVTPVSEESDRQRIRRSSVGVYYLHHFNPQLSGRVNLDFSDIDFNTLNNTDTRAYGGSLSGNYAYHERLSFGVHGSARYRESLGVGLQSSSTSISGSVALSVAAELDDGLDISLQIGPSVVQTKADDRPGVTTPEFQFASDGRSVFARAIDFPGGTCSFQQQDLVLACPFVAFDTNFLPTTTNPDGLITLAPPANSQGESTTEPSYFAEATLTKKWQQHKLYLTYTRSESASSGSATSSILDVVEGRLTYEPGPGWFLSFQAEWSHREYVGDVVQSFVAVVPGGALVKDPNVSTPPGPFQFARAVALTTVVTTDGGSADEEVWRVTFSGKRRLTRQITAIGVIQYGVSDQQQQSFNSKIETLYGYVGLRYEFDPFIF
jgi:hypothetical protein